MPLDCPRRARFGAAVAAQAPALSEKHHGRSAAKKASMSLTSRPGGFILNNLFLELQETLSPGRKFQMMVARVADTFRRGPEGAVAVVRADLVAESVAILGAMITLPVVGVVGLLGLIITAH